MDIIGKGIFIIFLIVLVLYILANLSSFGAGLLICGAIIYVAYYFSHSWLISILIFIIVLWFYGACANRRY